MNFSEPDMEADHAYFERRALEERKAAQVAATKWQRESHLTLADRYEDLAAAIVAHRRLLGRDL
jgi:hypothetical protein